MFEDRREVEGVVDAVVVKAGLAIPLSPLSTRRRLPKGAGRRYDYHMPVRWTEAEWQAFAAVCNHYGINPTRKARELLAAWAALVAP